MPAEIAITTTDDAALLRRRLQWALNRLYFAGILIPGEEEGDPPWVVLDSADELEGEGGNTPLEAVDSATHEHGETIEQWWKDDEAKADIKVTVTVELFLYEAEAGKKTDGDLIEKARAHGRLISQTVDRAYGARKV
jgi:hypothetical protein